MGYVSGFKIYWVGFRFQKIRNLFRRVNSKFQMEIIRNPKLLTLNIYQHPGTTCGFVNKSMWNKSFCLTKKSYFAIFLTVQEKLLIPLVFFSPLDIRTPRFPTHHLLFITSYSKKVVTSDSPNKGYDHLVIWNLFSPLPSNGQKHTWTQQLE